MRNAHCCNSHQLSKTYLDPLSQKAMRSRWERLLCGSSNDTCTTEDLLLKDHMCMNSGATVVLSPERLLCSSVHLEIALRATALLQL